MTNLPAPTEPTGVSLGGQAALWADPDGLLVLPVARLRALAVEVAHEAGPLLAQIRRVAGLVAWAGWHRLNEKDYRTFAVGLAHDLGIEVDTLRRWRRTVVEREHLAVPGGLPAARSTARRGAKSPGQPEGKAFHPAPELPARSNPPEVGAAPSAPREAARNGSGRVVPPEPQSAPARPVERPITDAEGLRWLTSKTDAQVRAMGDPYGPATRAEVCRWAAAWGGQDARAVAGAVAARRSGTITRPEDRLLAPTNGGCSHPRDRQQNKGYAIVCGLCHARVR